MDEMQEKSDAQLLREYVQHGVEEAFSELVHRRTNLVYSAALRQAGSSAAAAEIAQRVFVGLARNATSVSSRLTADASLAGWLCRSARNQALNLRRDEYRRRTRERQAMEQLIPDSDAAPDWQHLRPVLDEAMAELDDADYDTLVLRFFENQNFRAVGAAIGVSDDAAQKRVARALEKLREMLSRRGIRASAAALSALIPANAIQSAPAGLAAAISAAALAGSAAFTTSTLLSTTKVIAMTTLQKTLVAAAIAVLGGAGIYEARQAVQWRGQYQTLQQQEAGRIRQLESERNAALNRLARFSAPATPRSPAPAVHFAPQTNGFANDAMSAANLYVRFKDGAPQLTPGQIGVYLKANGRTAASLLAAYRTSADHALLEEAMEKFPHDPQVAFEAIFDPKLSSDEKRQWLNTFEQAAPGNAMANYLSALDYFNSGQIDLGLQELTAAAGKTEFQDFTLERGKSDEEAYLAAGYSEAEAGYLGTSKLVLPQLGQIKQLGQDLVDLANAYGQSGDSGSAQAVLQMALNLGQRYASPSGRLIIDQFYGIAVERMSLLAMDPQSAYGDSGRTVQDQLDQLIAQRTSLKNLSQQVQNLLPTVSDQDWIGYTDRRMIFGEVAADQWLVNKMEIAHAKTVTPRAGPSSE
jgi:RNA polymerase sigma factor (sigma-70 family)